MKKIVLLISILLLAVSLVGCGGDNKKAEKPAAKEIKIGATAGPHAQVVEAVAKEGKKQGLNIKVIEFSDYIRRIRLWLTGKSIWSATSTNRLWRISTSRISRIWWLSAERS